MFGRVITSERLAKHRPVKGSATPSMPVYEAK